MIYSGILARARILVSIAHSLRITLVGTLEVVPLDPQLSNGGQMLKMNLQSHQITLN